ncbi:hypothetical protein [Bowdeniella massiliensis]|uniref:hypothetical protein n=1 Tax=Bowdeniella massiliensis TaxID=2932264 RepID=UPI002027954A|nr:hypothetical protein [Bowdeniella massiliensis]
MSTESSLSTDDVMHARAVATARLSLIVGVALAFATGALSALLVLSTPKDAAGQVALWLAPVGLLGSLVIAGLGLVLVFAPEPRAALLRHARGLRTLWRLGAIVIIASVAGLMLMRPGAWLVTILGTVVAAHFVVAAYVLSPMAARRADPKPLGAPDRLAEF